VVNMTFPSKKIFNKKDYKYLRKKLRGERSYSERLLWMKIRNSQIGFKFRRQHGIGIYVVDFYCPEIKLIVEVDGASHETEDELKADKIREDFLFSLGLKVKRYYNEDVKNNTEAVLEDLLDCCVAMRKNKPHPTSPSKGEE
jgi:very-short-patch-repair endonuclease